MKVVKYLNIFLILVLLVTVGIKILPLLTAKPVGHYDHYTYYYDQLNDKEKIAYDNIYKSYKDLTVESIVMGINLSEYEVRRAIMAVYKDNPDFLYSEYFTFKEQPILKITYYCPELSELDSVDMSAVEKYSINILSDLGITAHPQEKPSEELQYDIAKTIYYYVIKMTDYDINCPYNQDIRSVLFNQKSVCSGYAKTYQYLCNLAGVDCTLVTGKCKNGSTEGTHAWNMVHIGDKYHYVDPTWGDSLPSGKPNYDYFMIGDELLQTHTIKDNELLLDGDATSTTYFIYPKCEKRKEKWE